MREKYESYDEKEREENNRTCPLLDAVEADGIAIGVEQGRREGEKRGIERGIERGVSEAEHKIVSAMFRKNQTPEFISEMTELPLSYVYEIKEEMNCYLAEPEVEYKATSDPHKKDAE